MLKLKNIVKTYVMGDARVEALKGVDLEFRKNDFVSILGPSGCGKTTMLNIIGGLDRYTSGDLVINGVSTKEYKDVDWDIYRNNSIGFVFQGYNLISHQTAYSNVELAMTLAGVSPAERKKRVIEVLKKVGLGDQIHKKPTQMSGGQMQRVAIARALVNNPEILLADEPTGALDSETSIQVMELLKEIARDRLVIMVTHNGDIAEKYSTRIIRLLDGRVIDDTNPYVSEEEPKKEKGKRKKVSMSFFTALALSFKNLLTKKTRTILTAFAGSIGIIGIALILSLSDGMQGYINNLERDTLSTYPIEIQSQSMDMGGMMSMMMDNNRNGGTSREQDKVYANNIAANMIQSLGSQIQNNDLSQFKKYLESGGGKQFYEYSNFIQYGYDVELQIYKADAPGGVLQVNPSEVMSNLNMGGASSGGGMNMGMNMGGGELWSEMLGNEDLLRSQYDVVAGRWAAEYDEVVLVLNGNNEISDINLYALGLLDYGELEELMGKAMKGEEIRDAVPEKDFSYGDILSTTFKLLLNTDYYVKEDNIWTDKREDAEYMKNIIENAPDIKIVGVIKPSADAAATSISGCIGYTSALTDYVIGAIHETDVAKEQLAAIETDVFTGTAFGAGGSAADLTDNLRELGIVDFDSPNSVRLYPKDFDSKKKLETLIEDYNKMNEAAGNDEYVINYTDLVGLMTSSISSIIGIVSYVLIAFVAISLVVSSIMIAIITYISVLERTKEIGILRSIGASKKDITRVFNAETVIEGFVAGGMGVLITLLLNLPINMIIKSLAGVSGLSALPLYGAVGLIVISVILTVTAGFIPSKMAAKKDPVAALRSE